jgi:uncharacterized protein
MSVTNAPLSRPSLAAKALRAMILTYQAASFGRRPACRFVPSCSNYALEAIDRFGAKKGIPLVLRRLGRCRPGGPFGLDPVPEVPGTDGTGSQAPEPRTGPHQHPISSAGPAAEKRSA